MTAMEAQILQWLREYLPTTPATLMGPGDDAALLDWSDTDRCLVATDTIVEGLDFTRETCELPSVGRKALAINLSDLAAMGGFAVSATASLVLPSSDAFATCREIIRGMQELAEAYDVSISGGDISIWDGPLIATVSAIGKPGPGGILTRSGAQEGDHILVTGNLGGSILSHHYTFTPRLKEIQHLTGNYSVHAAIDISDGLGLDLSRLAGASELAATITTSAVPIAPAAHTLAERPDSTSTALQHALQDGEDFELLLSVSPAVSDAIIRDQPLGCGISCIGSFSVGSGLTLRHDDGTLQPLEPRGYLHGEG